MMSLELAKQVAILSSGPMILLVIVSSIVLLDRNFFMISLLFLLFNTAFNVLLKNIWQVPLNPMVGHSGWAFPSGHMQLAFFLYASIAVYSRCWWGYIISGALLYFLACATQALGYHTWLEMIAACGFSIIILTILFASRRRFDRHFFISGAILLLTYLSMIIYCITIAHVTMKESVWLWFAFSFAVGIYIGHGILSTMKNDSLMKCSIIIKIMEMFISGVPLVIGLYILRSIRTNELSIICLSFCCGMWLSYISPRIISSLSKLKIGSRSL